MTDSYLKIVTNFENVVKSFPFSKDSLVITDGQYEENLQCFLCDLYFNTFEKYQKYALEIKKEVYELTMEDVYNIPTNKGDFTFYFNGCYSTIKTNDKSGRGGGLTSTLARKFLNQTIKKVFLE
jgi:hypothetical protein